MKKSNTNESDEGSFNWVIRSKRLTNILRAMIYDGITATQISNNTVQFIPVRITVNNLSTELAKLVKTGLLSYSGGKGRIGKEYHLTEKGKKYRDILNKKYPVSKKTESS